MDDARYEVRAATTGDQERLTELARFLDSVNLPNDPAAIRDVVAASEAAFSGNVGDPRLRQYVFVLWDRVEDRLVGTSMILGQLGRKDAPYIFLEVLAEEKYSPLLDRHFTHQVLRMGYSFNGPTEIGGLVMHPDYRRAPERLGMLISYVRFLFIRMHRDHFQNYVLAELMPPLEPDGTSHLWEAVGRRFTGLSYREADRLSKHDKSFIRNLFPDGDIYATLLSPAAQDVIGRVGRETRGVEKLLRRIGFRYADRVDPFDGGPHFVGTTDEISLVKRSAEHRAALGETVAGSRALVARDWELPPYFKAVAAHVVLSPQGEVLVSPEVAARLELEAGEPVWVLPLD